MQRWISTPGTWALIGIVGSFAFALAGGMLYRAEIKEAGYLQIGEMNADAAFKRAEAYVIRICAPLRVPDQQRCAADQQAAARQVRREERGLEAQQINATWTRYLGITGILGTSFGMLGLVLVLLTFRENKRSADAAQRALIHEHERTTAELRPWVKIEVRPTKFEIDADGLSIGYDVVFTNIGRTTAENFSFQSDCGFSRLETDKIDSQFAGWAEPTDRSRPAALMPGEQRSFPALQSAMNRAVPWSGTRTPRSVAYVVVASAFYWSAIDEKWHRTDRSFTIGRKDDSFNSGVFLYDDMVCHGVETVDAKPFWSGSTT
jgi:hypothetical protein